MTQSAVGTRAALTLLLVAAAFGLDFAMAWSRVEWAAIAGVMGAVGTLLGALVILCREPPPSTAEPRAGGAVLGQRGRIAAALGCAALVCAPVAAMGRGRPAGWILGVVVVMIAAAAVAVLRSQGRTH